MDCLCLKSAALLTVVALIFFLYPERFGFPPGTSAPVSSVVTHLNPHLLCFKVSEYHLQCFIGEFLRGFDGLTVKFPIGSCANFESCSSIFTQSY